MAGVSFIKILCHDSRLNINFKDRPLIWSPLQVDLGQKMAKHQTCIQWSSTAMRKQRAHETETESAPDFSGWDLVIRQRSRLNFCNLTLTRCSDNIIILRFQSSHQIKLAICNVQGKKQRSNNCAFAFQCHKGSVQWLLYVALASALVAFYVSPPFMVRFETQVWAKTWGHVTLSPCGCSILGGFTHHTPHSRGYSPMFQAQIPDWNCSWSWALVRRAWRLKT